MNRISVRSLIETLAFPRQPFCRVYAHTLRRHVFGKPHSLNSDRVSEHAARIRVTQVRRNFEVVLDVTILAATVLPCTAA